MVFIAFAAALSTLPAEKRNTEARSTAGNQQTNELWVQRALSDPLAVIALGQALLFVWQLIYMRRGLEDTEDAAKAAAASADAAKRSAEISERALTELERPIVSVDILDPELVMEQDNGRFRLQLRDSSKISLTNYGRTPAMLFEYSIRFDVVPRDDYNLPPVIDMSAPERLAMQSYGVFIAQGKPFEFQSLAKYLVFSR